MHNTAELQWHGRLHRLLCGDRRFHQEPRGVDALPQLVVAHREPADPHGLPRDHRERWHGGRQAEDRETHQQQQLLQVRDAEVRSTRVRRLRLTHHPSAAILSMQDRRVLEVCPFPTTYIHTYILPY